MEKAMNYVYGEVEYGARSCVLGPLQDVDDDYELLRGISRINGFPEDAYFRMSENFPRNLQLVDVLVNGNMLLVISERLKEFLREENLKNNEFIPVRIFNHKGRETKEHYYILHQTELQDCIDLSKSQVKINNINPEFISRVMNLVIDESRIDPDVLLFRMKRHPTIPLFRRDLAERIQSAGFIGISFHEIENWGRE